MLNFGTRGDIQPYIGLCTALIAAGHQADICTHPTHKPFIEEFGVGLVPYPGPHPQQLFDYCVRVGIFGYNFMLEISQLAHSFMSSWGQVFSSHVVLPVRSCFRVKCGEAHMCCVLLVRARSFQWRLVNGSPEVRRTLSGHMDL